MRYDPEKVCERILKQIRRYSEREGLTMSSLAREAGLSASTISEMMCGKTRPQVYTLMKICNVLDVSMDVLMGEFMEDGEVPEKPADCRFRESTMLCRSGSRRECENSSR